MSSSDPIVILSYARTPMGAMQGALGEVSASHLGAVAVKAAVERAGVAGADVERIYMGNVLSAGQGQAPARQAAIFAGLPQSVEATTVNKMCGSGMQAAIMGAEALAAGSIDIIVAGGMESMTNAPYLLPKMRSGARLGHAEAKDHMFLDGLEDAYEPGRAMGSFAEETVSEYQLTREAQDEYSIESLARAKDGTSTAANASSISDGAAAMVLTRASVAESRGLKPVARIVAHAAHAHAPSKFTTAPVSAIKKVLDKAGWSVADVDLWEVNEAFACVAMFAMQDIGISRDKLNINGGATALGHPIGASGARIMVTLIAALKKRGLKKGVAALCIGGGEATAVALELTD